MSSLERQFEYFAEVNPLFQMLHQEEKGWIMMKNRRLFVGHTWLKYFSGQSGCDQIAAFIGQSLGGTKVRRWVNIKPS